MPQMAPRGPCDPPEGSGTTFGGGWCLAVGGGRQVMAVGDCQLAVGSCPVGNGGTLSARDHHLPPETGVTGLVSADFGSFGPWSAQVLAKVAAIPRGFWTEMGQKGRKRVDTCPKGPFDPPPGSETTFENSHF